MIYKEWAKTIASADCAAIAAYYGSELHKSSSGKYWGPCPICGGTDRFEVYTDKRNGISRWSCRGCRVTCGDALDLVMKAENIPSCDTQRGIDKLSWLTKEENISFSGGPKGNPAPKPAAESLYKSAEWQRIMNNIVLESVADLWNSTAGQAAQAYLFLDRWLTENVLKESRVGYNPRLRSYHIDGVKVYVFPGIVIPSYEETPGSSPLTRVKIRLEETQEFKIQNKGQKYSNATGSRGDGLFMGIHALKYHKIIWCEGEMDALSINSLGLPDIRAVTFGSATGCGKIGEFLDFYIHPNRSIICFDNDPAGNAGSRNLWREMRKTPLRKPLQKRLPEGFKDFNEILTKAGEQKLREVVTSFFDTNSLY